MIFLKNPIKFLPTELKENNPKEIFKKFRPRKEREREGFDYSNFKTFLIGRNPYSRILSGFIDKYVNQNSQTPEIGPQNISYYEFIKLIGDLKAREIGISNFVQFSCFCNADEDEGYDFYQKIGKPNFNFISLMDNLGFPEGALHHSVETIKKITSFLPFDMDYERAIDLVPVKNIEQNNKILDYDIAYWPMEKLWKYILENGNKSIDIRSFYPQELKDLFVEAYANELMFYRKQGIEFEKEV
jgi:hypothetical protein